MKKEKAERRRRQPHLISDKSPPLPFPVIVIVNYANLHSNMYKCTYIVYNHIALDILQFVTKDI